MLKISHESPLLLLNQSFLFNDFDYLLYHLIDKYSEYALFFRKSKELNRISILDNSAYELYNHSTGQSDYDIEKFVNHIKEYSPTYYILPDYFNDGKKTIKLAKDFFKKYKITNSLPLGVIQGKTLKEYIECYKFMCDHAEILGFNFMQGLYIKEAEKRNKSLVSIEDKLSEGRKYFIEMLEEKGIINKNKKHHLLGTMYPQDIAYFKNKEYIISADTSNPILHGMLNIKYIQLENNLWGLKEKTKVKMHNMMENKITKKQMEIINFNIQKFKENLK